MELILYIIVYFAIGVWLMVMRRWYKKRQVNGQDWVRTIFFWPIVIPIRLFIWTLDFWDKLAYKQL